MIRTVIHNFKLARIKNYHLHSKILWHQKKLSLKLGENLVVKCLNFKLTEVYS